MDTGIVSNVKKFKVIRPYVEERFGICYECRDGYCDRCIGVPCDCECPAVQITTRCDAYALYGCVLINHHRGMHRDIRDKDFAVG